MKADLVVEEIKINVLKNVSNFPEKIPNAPFVYLAIIINFKKSNHFNNNTFSDIRISNLLAANISSKRIRKEFWHAVAQVGTLWHELA